MIFSLVWQGHGRDYIPDTNIDHHAELVQDTGQRRSEIYQLEDLALADELAAAVVGASKTKPEVAVRPFGA
jgi:hypothetical protein